MPHASPSFFYLPRPETLSLRMSSSRLLLSDSVLMDCSTRCVSSLRRGRAVDGRSILRSSWSQRCTSAKGRAVDTAENAHVRVLDTRIAPGEQTPAHTHRWPAAHYVVSWSDFVRRAADGTVLLDTRMTESRTVPVAASAALA